MKISDDQVSAASGARSESRSPVEADVAEIVANYRDHGIGFFARLGEGACAVFFHSPWSRRDVIAKATKYARDVMHARETRVRL